MTRDRSIRRAVPAVVFGVALLAGCTTTEPTDSAGSGTDSLVPPVSAPSTGPTGGRGPRVLPATFVPVEVAAFPRPAAEACQGNREIRVADAAGLVAELASAVPGTTIRVAAGRYVLPTDDDVAVRLAVGDVCLRGDGGPAVVVAGPGQRTGIEVTGDDVAVERLSVRGFEVGVSLGRQDGRTQRRVTLEHVTVEEMTGDFRDGIVVYPDHRELAGAPPVVDGLLLLDVLVDGADLSVSCNAGPCEHWWLEAVRVTSRRGSDDTGADAVAIESGRQIVIVEATVGGAAGDGIDIKAADVVVAGTRVQNVARNGIKLWHGGDVINTIVDGSGADAALVGEHAARYRYLHVLVTRHLPGESGYVGTWAYDSGEPVELEIVNSIFADNSSGGLFAAGGSMVRLRSIIVDAGSGERLLEVGDRAYDVADLERVLADGIGEDVIIASPRLAAPDRGDFTTASDSPARDRARAVSGLDRDIDGRARVLGAGPDIGPVESG